MEKLFFASDYQEGAHPAILSRLVESNLDKTPGYGTDAVCAAAREKIRAACACPDAEVHFLVGGTQANLVMIDAILRSYQGVIAADTGHISSHEAGAIEAGGHKVLTLPNTFGMIEAGQIRRLVEAYYGDGNRDHLVMPGMVYLSQPTEYGTLYSLAELTAISACCREYGLPLYVDGARLAYALACPSNDATLADLARLCDAFYLGGTKCGALFGEAVVLPKSGSVPHLFTIIKQHGALLAKGRLLGLQFDALFTDGLYECIGAPAIKAAERIREALSALGYRQLFETPTNQIFCVMEDALLPRLQQQVEYSFWERADETHTVIRLASSWATRPEDVDRLLAVLTALREPA